MPRCERRASCDPPAQKVLAVTHTMISRFLEQARTGNYIGFPADGFCFELDEAERKKISAEKRKEALKTMYFDKLQNVPTSPRKMRLVADMIRGMRCV